MPFEFLDDIATADIAFTAWGEDLEEMFTAAADATMNVMVENLDGIERGETRQIEGKSESVDMLLFGLLQEIIFFKDAERLLLRVDSIRIGYEDGLFSIVADAKGEEIDPERHNLVVDVKAVTLHQFKVEQTHRGWESLVVLDI